MRIVELGIRNSVARASKCGIERCNDLNLSFESSIFREANNIGEDITNVSTFNSHV